MVTWGDSLYGGDSSSVASKLTAGVKKIYSSKFAFAAVKTDGSAFSWGWEYGGGDYGDVARQLSSGVKKIVPGAYGFAALKTDGSVVTWGNPLGWLIEPTTLQR